MLEQSEAGSRRTLIVCGALTALAALLASPTVGSIEDLAPALVILVPWGLVTAVLSVIYFFWRMYERREASPLAAIRTGLAQRPAATLFFPAMLMLAALNLVVFMWIKAALNGIVPFRADEILAAADNLLFLGNDPWMVLPPAPSWASFVYHPLWLLSLLLALAITAAAKPSASRTAILLAYFALWTIAAPLVHTIMPAVGPIFYERMGYGDRFAGLPYDAETLAVSDYLWTAYTSGVFNTGAGISAMPSMHVTMSAWAALAVQAMAPRLSPIAWGAYGVIFYLSIALGWHYALDGVIGTGLAFAFYRASLFWAQRKPVPGLRDEPVPVA